MGKTTNILDLNNRLEKVEKEKEAQNNYNSLKNRPKINGNLLTGDKTGTQLGLAEAQDIGDLSNLTTTDKSSAVAAINEVNGLIGSAVRVEKVNLSSQTSFSTGVIDLQFTIPTITGYVPVGILNYNFSDRGISQKIFISGFDITSGTTAHIYGSVTDNVILTTNAYVMILYKKLIN